MNALSPSRSQPSDPAEALKNALVDFFERGGGALDETIEAYVIRTAYEFCHRNQLETARLLGISRNVVRARLLRCGELTGKRRTRDHPPEAKAPLAHAPVEHEHENE